MAMSPGLFRKIKTTLLTQACAKRKRHINGGSWNDDGNARGKPFICRKLLASSPEKSPNFGEIKAMDA